MASTSSSPSPAGWSSDNGFDVSPSSSTCSLAHLLQSSPVALGPAPSSSRGQRQRRDRSVSSDSDASSCPLPPAYVDSAAPPAYTSQPSQTITVSRAAFDSLSARPAGLTLEQALALSIDAEIVERARRREAEIRTRLEPLLFPEPRSLADVVGGLFCRGKRAGRRPPPPTMDDLDEDERTVARKMVDEVCQPSVLLPCRCLALLTSSNAPPRSTSPGSIRWATKRRPSSSPLLPLTHAQSPGFSYDLSRYLTTAPICLKGHAEHLLCKAPAPLRERPAVKLVDARALEILRQICRCAGLPVLRVEDADARAANGGDVRRKAGLAECRFEGGERLGRDVCERARVNGVSV
jgi:hypothetical protein